MNYKNISSKILIANVFDRYNIDYAGFIPRVPNWVHGAMRELKIHQSLVNETIDGEVSSYKAAIPSECQVLMAVSYEGLRLPRTDTINQKTNDEMSELENEHLYHSYELDNNGYIITTFEECEEGDLKFYIKKLPSTLDTTTNLYFPDIPDNEDLLRALESYILTMLLNRGHKVNTFSLDSNNPFKNPALAWENSKKKVRNSVAALDMDSREAISDMKRTFLTDYNYYSHTSYNPYNK